MKRLILCLNPHGQPSEGPDEQIKQLQTLDHDVRIPRRRSRQPNIQASAMTAAYPGVGHDGRISRRRLGMLENIMNE